MHSFDTKFAHFCSGQKTCVRLEAFAECGNLDDLAYRESLEEDARRPFTLLACIRECQVDTNCLYLDGPPLALLTEHAKKLQVSCTHPLQDHVGYVKLTSKPIINRDVEGGYFVRLASKYMNDSQQSEDLLSSIDLRGKRLDIDTAERKWRLHDQIRCIDQFCARESVPAVLLVDETRSPQEFKALNRDETFPVQIRNAIIDTFKSERSLNVAQLEALEHAMCHHITCIQGPPGTGKTQVGAAIASAMYQLQKLPSQRQCFTLVTAPTNQGVDNFEEKISKTHPDQVHRWGNVEKQKCRAKEKGLEVSVDHWVQEQCNRMHISCFDAIEQTRGVFLSGTCNSFAAKAWDNVQVSVARIIVDECAQAASWEWLAPCAKLEKQGALVFIGDQNQLPPCLKSFEAQRRGGHVSILEYCFRNPAHKKIVLEAQFRMHPDLLCYLNTISYNDRLYSTMVSRQQGMPKSFPTGNQERLVFINCQGREKQTGSTFYNDDEAKHVIDCVRKLLSSGEVSGQEITILAAYQAQVTNLRSRLENKRNFKGVQVSTLDGFQGRENKFIILSTVRNNELGSIGFLSSSQRVTVAFSRAKAAMIVFGNVETLLCDDREGVWKTLFKRCKVCDTRYHAMEVDLNPKDKQQKRSDSYAEPKHCSKKVRINESETVATQLLPELDRDRLLQEVDRSLHWVNNFLNLAQKLTRAHGFCEALNMVAGLKKNGNPGTRTTRGASDHHGVNDTRKTWSHLGYAVFWGISKLKDPTNLVYYAAFQALLSRQGWTIPGLDRLQNRFVKSELPPVQLQKVRAAVSMNSGVLVDAGDHLECLLAICNAEDRYTVTNRCVEVYHPARLSTDEWLDIRYHLDQLISVTDTVLQLCFRLSQTDNYAFQSEFTLNVIRDLVRLENNNYVFPATFVKIIEEVHGRIRSSRSAAG